MKTLTASNPRKIIHIDMDAFYASVEQRDFPELRGKPLVVGGDPNGRGVVAAASYEVRQFGVRSAMSCYEARKRCPEVIFVRPRFEVYRAVSSDIRNIMYSLTPHVEPLSLDEAYLEVTGLTVHKGSATLMANWLRAQILQHTGLTASAGVSFNKMLAKIASDINKPNGTAIITPEDADAFISTLPIERFHGIGKATARRLHAMGVTNGADLRRMSAEVLINEFGKRGQFYHDIAHGRDERAAAAARSIRPRLGGYLARAAEQERAVPNQVAQEPARQPLLARRVAASRLRPDSVPRVRHRRLAGRLRERHAARLQKHQRAQEDADGAVGAFASAPVNARTAHRSPQ